MKDKCSKSEIERRRLEAIVETAEIMANPAAMKAIRDFEAGTLELHDVLDED